MSQPRDAARVSVAAVGGLYRSRRAAYPRRRDASLRGNRMINRNFRAGRPLRRRIAAVAMSVLAAIAFAAPAAADPPPWAQAHGYRAKKGGPTFVVQLPPVLRGGRCQSDLLDKETAGGLIGAAAGGLVGSQIG